MRFAIAVICLPVLAGMTGFTWMALKTFLIYGDPHSLILFLSACAITTVMGIITTEALIKCRNY